MLIRCESSKLNTGYCKLEKNIKYRVLALMLGFDGECQVLIATPERPMSPYVAAYPLSWFRVIDDTPEADWSTGFFTNEVSVQTLVYGFPELTRDVNLLLRLHDQDAEQEDIELLYHYYESYSGNSADASYDERSSERRKQLV